MILTGAIMAAGIVYSVDHVYKHVLQEHQRTRIDVLLGKETDLKGRVTMSTRVRSRSVPVVFGQRVSTGNANEV